MENKTQMTDEHILVCLSPSPTNAKIVRTAARMASAWGARLTALYVKTPADDTMPPEERERLAQNTHLAEELGAETASSFGESIAQQIAEFARLSGVSKVVIGRSAAAKRRILRKPTLTEELIELAPGLDIHIIPDSAARFKGKESAPPKRARALQYLRDAVISMISLLSASLVALLFFELGFTGENIITVYILALLVNAVMTSSVICWSITSLLSVFIYNFFFTLPRYDLPDYRDGYIITFVIMLAASILAGGFAKKIRNHARESAKLAYRTKILFDTSRLLAAARNADEIISATAGQAEKLISCDLAIYMGEPGSLRAVYLTRDGLKLPHDGELQSVFSPYVTYGEGRGDYEILPIGAGRDTLGAVVVYRRGQTEPFENSILSSIISECALALKNEKNEREKREADIRAENEKLRANLLRTISHDLRTPLTSISGNADNLMSNASAFSEEMKREIYKDIYDDSMWLVSLVENLLSVTRIDGGRMNINMREELVDEVVGEALSHTGRSLSRRSISVDISDEPLLAKMDARLIVQLIVNLVDNAIKYTPDGSAISIGAHKADGLIYISVADNGPGISDEVKPKVFDMFFTGEGRVADGRRSLGLGLSLCRSIVTAHGGEIAVTDNSPTGAVFTFTLKEGTSVIHE